MVDKLKNIDTTLDPTAEDFKSRLNANFKEIKEKVGLNDIEGTVTIPSEGYWHMPEDGNTVPDVNNPNGAKLEETLVGFIDQRAMVYAEVTDPDTLHVTYTKLQIFPHTVDLNQSNVTMRKEIARCGIELVAHTKLDGLIAGTGNKKKLYFMFVALTAKPSVNIVFDFVLT